MKRRIRLAEGARFMVRLALLISLGVFTATRAPAQHADLCVGELPAGNLPNGILEPGEECDDGNLNSNDSCVSSCQIARCQDGYLCTEPDCTSGPDGGPEVCDEGLSAPGNWACLPDCSGFQVCGDGVVNGDEQCDALLGNCCSDLDGCVPIPDWEDCFIASVGSGCCAGACLDPVPDIDGDGLCDLSDPCPAQQNNGDCDPLRSAAAAIGPDGGTINTSADSGTIAATVVIPAGALDEDVAISLTENGPAMRFGLKKKGGDATVLSVSARPDQHFNVPVQVTLRWDDRDMDGYVDKGLCDGGSDDGLSCDNVANSSGQSDCALPGLCKGGGNLHESDVVLKRNSARFSDVTCADHLAGTGCETAAADCNVTDSTVAKCCDPSAGPGGTRTFGEWTFETCDFSEFFIGLTAGDLVPGKGSPKSDCAAEWQINNPLNAPYLDNRDLPHFKQRCNDGDPVCDADGAADGKCVFKVGVCVNVNDPRLANEDDSGCTPSGVAIWEIKRPRPGSHIPVEGLNAVAVRDAVAALGAATMNGRHPRRLVFTSPITKLDSCTALVPFEVPLVAGTEKGKATLKTRTETTPPAGKRRGTKDSDTLKLTCLSSQ